MTTKEYLGQVYRIDKRINSKLEQIRLLRELVTNTTITLSDLPKSPSRDVYSTQTIISKMVDLENEINRNIDMLVSLRHDIQANIYAVVNLDYQTLLEQRYLCFYSWDQIAENMGYSIQHVYRLHSKALIAIDLQRYGDKGA